MRAAGILMAILMLAVALTGCTNTPAKSSYSVDNTGILSVTCAPAPMSEQVLFSNETYTESKIVLHTESGDVTTYLAAPKKPKAAIVYVPGAGETIAAHSSRMEHYTAAGYVFYFIDTRGRGGETPGEPFGQQLLQEDYNRFKSGEWPQYYLTICDLVNARQLLADRYSVPVYAMGSSNGGRYAAVAAGVDPKFAGYVGISTSDWGLLDSVNIQSIPAGPLRFATSLEPGSYLPLISPRPVWIFHARDDPVIPFADGEQFFTEAKEPKNFTEFSGTHGINADVDGKIIAQWAQIYGT